MNSSLLKWLKALAFKKSGGLLGLWHNTVQLSRCVDLSKWIIRAGFEPFRHLSLSVWTVADFKVKYRDQKALMY